MTKLYDLALEIATEAHRGQKDKAGADYILHPIRVASFVKTDEEKATALLHDVIEDSNITKSNLIKRGIPKRIADAIEILSKREGGTYSSYLEMIKSNELARVVKLADLKHNSEISRILNPKQIDYDRLEKYKKAIEYLS